MHSERFPRIAELARRLADETPDPDPRGDDHGQVDSLAIGLAPTGIDSLAGV